MSARRFIIIGRIGRINGMGTPPPRQRPPPRPAPAAPRTLRSCLPPSAPRPPAAAAAARHSARQRAWGGCGTGVAGGGSVAPQGGPAVQADGGKRAASCVKASTPRLHTSRHAAHPPPCNGNALSYVDIRSGEGDL